MSDNRYRPDEPRSKGRWKRVVSDRKDIPAVLPAGVDRALVEAQWNHVPLCEPPLWWDDANPPASAEGKSWLRFLVDKWHKALLKPLTLAELRRREMVTAAGRALSQQLTDLAIEVLTDGPRDG